MFSFLIHRLMILIPTFIGVTLAAFAFIRVIPGDPILVMAGERGITPERHAEMMTAFGFDKPIWEQYFSYIWQLLQGDLGTSIVTKQPVLEEFAALFPATIELSICALIVATVIGIPAGIIAAVKRGSFFDHSLMTLSLTGFSMPIFWWALLLIVFFSGFLGWTPVSGRISVMFYFDSVTGFMLIDSWLSGEEGAFKSALSHLILPSIALGTIPMAVFARQTRSAMLEILNEDFIKTARAKGLSNFRVIVVHAFRNALIPVITVIGLSVGVLLAGAILTETIFSWPGIGKWMVDSIFRRDYPVVQGGLILIAGIVMIINLTVDLCYGLIDPRIRNKR
ncbi:ABC transporter permease subunit [Motiliproteus sp. MSK22-1]|uniref:ABC transporter permease subunit n=1 Tax=Motiliproteus sp. MSK22-1 TaxID=1897630 RepID=UPI0009768B5A|nr:ABC transporter permease subunit [Motiliproteus sp. MSK22-1]OMH38095.1 peptide ABC transporter permease [Motiliproteus sp. MSK22-1]